MTCKFALPLLFVLPLAACNSNSAPGNDQEAALEAPATASQQASAADALSGIATGAIQPETMTDADTASLGGTDGRCVFRMTEVGYPSFLYGGSGGTGTIKLNGTLITLPAVGNGRYQDGGLRVTLTPIDAETGRGDRREAEMIVQLPGAPDELGFRGYEQCAGN